jgi:hypothetical protein
MIQMSEFLVVSLVTILGSGLSVYVGVRVALAKMQAEIDTLKQGATENRRRIERLEATYFRSSE